MKTIGEQQNIFLRMHPLHRILVSLLAAGLAFLLVGKSIQSGIMRWVAAWDVFAFAYCLVSWVVFFTRSTEQIKRQANKDDGSRLFVIFLLLLACFASMVMVLLMMLSKQAAAESQLLYTISSIFGMMLSWALVHTTFSFHYAHLYYNSPSDQKKNQAGLEFPGEKDPDYVDFAYFSFVIGMTFQVSDVEINTKLMRRMVLLHSLLSFLLNTFVVALTINLVAGLRN